ncbi:copper resistance protein CopC [Paenibacillus sp. CF384]|uniref:copper resistance CopC family protein n=1 Tax=Paenibacillus sp. CF384 TaxID=1884382 RepID=UPI000894AB66|nr:copper resistance protein CopC [Paenibacillus sp. CF384]SDW04083.1 hypothetical protein SAMN05518855_100154 [Paenibacillus sp. CF384]
MNKFFAICLVLFVVAMLPQTASAHTDLKDSTPAKDETVTTALSEIQLTFATQIEPVVVLKVTDASHKEIPVKAEADKNDLTGVFETPLANGTYTVNWRIIGEDGHNITGEYSFTVALPAESTPVPDNTATPEIAPDSGTANSQVNTQTEPNESSETTNTSESVNSSNAATLSAENVFPEEVIPAAANHQSNKNKTVTVVVAVGCLVLLLFLFRAVMKK